MPRQFGGNDPRKVLPTIAISNVYFATVDPENNDLAHAGSQ